MYLTRSKALTHMSGSRERRMMTVVRPAPEGGLQPEQAVRGLCREALSLRSALDMDCWISSLLGQIWEQRKAAPPVRELDRTFALGVPMMVNNGLARAKVIANTEAYRGLRAIRRAFSLSEIDE